MDHQDYPEFQTRRQLNSEPGLPLQSIADSPVKGIGEPAKPAGLPKQRRAGRPPTKPRDEKRATGKHFRRKVFLGYRDGKKHFSIGRGSKYFNQQPPPGEVWDYE